MFKFIAATAINVYNVFFKNPHITVDSDGCYIFHAGIFGNKQIFSGDLTVEEIIEWGTYGVLPVEE